MARKRAREAATSTIAGFLEETSENEKPSKPSKTTGAAVTVYMLKDTRDAYQQLADAQGVTRTAAMRYALEWFIQEVEAGRAAFEFTATKQLKRLA